MTRHWTPSAKSGRPSEIVSWIDATRSILFGFPCLCLCSKSWSTKRARTAHGKISSSWLMITLAVFRPKRRLSFGAETILLTKYTEGRPVACRRPFHESRRGYLVVREKLENPYFQYFCGEEFFQHVLVFDRSSLTRWRQRMGEEKLQALLQESLAVATRTDAMKPSDLARVV